jgi:hypothetical protein
VLAVVVVIVGWPLRARRLAASSEAGHTGPGAAADPQGDLAELEAERDAKYREIRDAELDHRTGKLSDADFQAIDRNLRAEAVEILRQIDRYHDNAK